MMPQAMGTPLLKMATDRRPAKLLTPPCSFTVSMLKFMLPPSFVDPVRVMIPPSGSCQKIPVYVMQYESLTSL
jgi:hypothetical protein